MRKNMAATSRSTTNSKVQRGILVILVDRDTGELGYDGPLYDGFLHMTDYYMLGPTSMHIKYLSYVYDGFCI